MTDKMKKKRCRFLKVLAIIVVVLVVLGTACGNYGDENQSTNSNPDSSEFSEPKDDIGVSTQEEDISIITREGHPTYYGSTIQAHRIWDDLARGKVIFADSFDSYTDDTIIFMDGYHEQDVMIDGEHEKDIMIGDIEIYFQNCQPAVELSLDSALSIASEFIPYDIIEKWYEFSRSESIQPIDKSAEKDSYFVVSYSLTDAASDAYYKHEHPYTGSVDIILEQNAAGFIDSIQITFGTPRWMGSLDVNGYKSVAWDFDFCQK